MCFFNPFVFLEEYYSILPAQLVHRNQDGDHEGSIVAGHDHDLVRIAPYQRGDMENLLADVRSDISLACGANESMDVTKTAGVASDTHVRGAETPLP